MKTKTYTFTHIEVLALRDAMGEQKLRLKPLNPNSPIFKQIKTATSALYEQFKSDIMVGRV